MIILQGLNAALLIVQGFGEVGGAPGTEAEGQNNRIGISLGIGF